MGFVKHASIEVLEVEQETLPSHAARTAGLSSTPAYESIQTEAGKRQAHRATFEYERRPGYIYVRSRAISSRTNDNYDEFPAEEIAKSWRTFIGKPVFVNHHNDDHRRSRGVIIDAALHKDANPDGTPDTWVEVLMEVDALRFPLLASAVVRGDIARTSMGTNVEYSICTACGNKAYSPVEYCQHIPRMKGMKIRRTTGSGGQEEVLIAERCYGLGFFENSLLVEDPADPTAFVLGVDGEGVQVTAGARSDAVADWLIDKTPLGRGVRKREEEARQEQRDQINNWADTMQRMIRHAADEDLEDAEWDAKHHAFFKDNDGNYYHHDVGPTRPHVDPDAIPAGSVMHHLTPAEQAQPGYGGGSAQHMHEVQDAADAAVERQHRQLWRQNHPGVPYNPSYTPTASRTVESHDRYVKHKHRCRFPVWGPFGVAACGLGLDRDDACSQHGPQGAGSLAPQMPVAASAGGYERHVVKAEETRVGDRLDRGGKTRISKTHDHNGKRHVQTQTIGTRSPSVQRWDHGTEVTVWRKKASHTAANSKNLPGFCGYDNSEYNDADTARALSSKTAQGEVKAPAQVDTMRAERCPVCQDDEAYDGDRCGICGYVAPPEMFRDPDLDKAREVDLRQDALETPDDEGNMQVATDDVDGQAGVLTCDACGEEFGPDAEADEATSEGDYDALTDEAPQTAPDDAAEPAQSDDAQAPDDLSDLAEQTDEELGLAEDEAEGFDADADTPQAQSPVEGDESIDNADDTSGLSPDQLADSVDKGEICPICGQGTIVSVQPEAPAKGPVQKEKSKDMNDHPQDQKPVNPAKAARNRILRALLGQQQVIEAQQARIASLTDMVLEIGSAAGLSSHPKFAALRKSADDTNQTPETAPATTSQEARQPDATDDPNNVGASPDGANVNVTPQAVTDLASTDKVEPGQAPLSNLVDVTAPPPASVQSAPAPGPGDKVINPVTVGTPTQDVMDPAGSTGWTASKGDPQERYTASLRLARLRIAAGLERGEDLAIGERIAASGESLDAIKASASTLSESLSAQHGQAPTRRQAQTLVPRSANQSTRAPSLAGDGAEGIEATAAVGNLDEWGDFGMGDLAAE